VHLIPFNRPLVPESAYDYLRQALAGQRLCGDGPFTLRCQALLEELLGAARVLLTTSCTHALEMAALLLGLQPGDEVLVPAFTFVSTANAFALHGGRPVFVDVRHDTLNLDETLLERALTPHTRAVVPVHYAGVACAMDDLLAWSRRHGVAVVEDNAHGLFGKYRGRPLGTFGCLATQSFHETKNFQCGEGGALVINDPQYVERAEVLRQKGTNRARFFRGQVDKYTWVDTGSSYVLADLLAALLLAQLEVHEQVQDRRGQLWETYADQLRDWATRQGVGLPVVPPGCEQTYHLFYLLLRSEKEQEALLAHLQVRGVGGVFHYQPLHLSQVGRRLGGREGDCPVAERVSRCLVRLPLYHGLAEAEQGRVIDAVRSFRGVQLRSRAKAG
jgi:dTDP-4-amino-4,6-dideoxygalactose transaminase